MSVKIYEAGWEEYPKFGVILGNLVMAFWIALGTLASWFFWPLAGWIYLVLAVTMVYGVLRKLVCTNCCYYGKRCPLGWGKLAALLFAKGDIEKFPTSLGIKAAPVTYGLLSLIPLVLVVVSLFQQFTVPKLVVLLLLLAVSTYSGVVSRGKACSHCKMKLVCPGCRAK